MGKIRIKTLGDETTEEAEKQKKAVKNAEKKAREASAQIDEEKKPGVTGVEGLPDSAQSSESSRARSGVETSGRTPEKLQKKSKFIKVKQRSAKYKTALLEIDKNKAYPLPEALEL